MQFLVRPNLRQKSALHFLYLAWAIFSFAAGSIGMLRVIDQVGESYGGFIWIYDKTLEPPFYVGPELRRVRPPSLYELRLFDQILAIEGVDPRRFGEVYDRKTVGELITYQVQRGGTTLTIKEPLRIFEWDDFVLSHGLVHAAGIAFLLAGYTLLKGTKRSDLRIFAFVFPVGAGSWFFHSQASSIHEPFIGSAILGFLLWMPTFPLVGALFFHFALQFPVRPNKKLLPRWQLILAYGFAVLVGGAYWISYALEYEGIVWIAYYVMIVYAAIAIAAVTIKICLILFSARYRVEQSSFGVARSFSAAWLVAAAILLLLGILPFLLLGYAVLPFEILMTLMILLPLVLVYALKNAEMLSQLLEEVELRRQYADGLAELRDIRERTLHDIGDSLHNLVLADVRGVSYAAVSARRRLAASQPTAKVDDDLRFIDQGLQQVTREIRGLIEGTKPINWQEMTLGEAVSVFVTQRKRSHQAIQLTLDVSGYDEADDPPLKEALYWITRNGVDNLLEHAEAQEGRICLWNTVDQVTLLVEDDGIGFDPNQERSPGERRRFGLANMRLRAAERGGAIDIRSRLGEGTTILVILPRREEEADDTRASG